VLQRFFIENFHQIVYENWLEMAVLSGALNLPAYETNPDRYRASRWIPRSWEWVDPQKEVNAYKDAVRCGFKTLGQVISEQGGDLDDVLVARQAELAMLDELDIVLDTDPSEVTIGGNAQPPLYQDAVPAFEETDRADGRGRVRRGISARGSHRRGRGLMAPIDPDRIKALQDRNMEEAQLPDPEVIETEETVEEETVEEERAMPGLGRHQRAELTTFDEVEDRTYEFPFSSEYPVARYFGNEILSHDVKAADLSRLNDGAPLLFNHNPDRVIGVVERAYIDGKKRRGYARVRFSRNAFAQEILSDVKDGVLRNVSFGYSIDKMEERGSGDFVATAWSPYEVSVVSVPADPGVGIGRSLEAEQAASAAPTPDPIPAMENTTPDLAVVRAEAAEAERSRIAGISALCDKHNMADLGRQLIESGRSIDDARAAVLDNLDIKQEPVTMSAAEIGLTAQESRSFSFMRAINYLANPTDPHGP
jgi:HK97 family phage prohead protease